MNAKITESANYLLHGIMLILEEDAVKTVGLGGQHCGREHSRLNGKCFHNRKHHRQR